MNEAVLELVGDDDLIGIGLRADAVRKAKHPENFVSYSVEPSALSADSGELLLAEEGLAQRLAEIRSLGSRIVRLLPSGGSVTAVETLKLIAIARICLEEPSEIEIAVEGLGLKFCQIALRFGVNDLGYIGTASEEEIRRLIRDAGFVPKRRDGNYRLYGLN